MKQLKNAVKVEVHYKASETLQKQLLAEGLSGKKIQKIDIETVNPEFLKLAKMTEDGRAIINLATDSWNDKKALNISEIEHNIPKLKVVVRGGNWFDHNIEIEKAEIESYKTQPEFETIPDEAGLLVLFNPDRKVFEKEAATKQKELDANLEKRKAEYLKKKAEQEKKQAEEKVKRENEEAEKKAKDEVLAKEIAQWIQQHGSDRLKAMFERGYEYRFTYEIERGNQELPNFIYDKQGDVITISKRANPSAEALELETKYLEKYPDAVQIGWGHERCWNEEQNEYVDIDIYGYGEELEDSEMIFINPNWSRQGFALFI